MGIPRPLLVWKSPLLARCNSSVFSYVKSSLIPFPKAKKKCLPDIQSLYKTMFIFPVIPHVRHEICLFKSPKHNSDSWHGCLQDILALTTGYLWSFSALSSSPEPCEGMSPPSNELGNWGQEELKNFRLRFSYKVEKTRFGQKSAQLKLSSIQEISSSQTWLIISTPPKLTSTTTNEELLRRWFLGHVPELLNLNQSYQST